MTEEPEIESENDDDSMDSETIVANYEELVQKVKREANREQEQKDDQEQAEATEAA